ncbi:hypothetical protein [Propionibacterium freudenreichii]|uniref:hypothetical protein n=2 Tax=Propionibacterium freudenreichii TaxID=1744 RepID=UPI003852978B
MRVLTLLTMAFATFTMWLPNGYWWARALVTTSLVVSAIIDIIRLFPDEGVAHVARRAGASVAG